MNSAHTDDYLKERMLNDVADRAPRLPARVRHLDEARKTHGQVVDRFLWSLGRTDPLADRAVDVLADFEPAEGHQLVDRAIAHARDVPEAIRALVDQAANFPVWVDEARLARAGDLLFRAGVPGGVALGAKSLLLGYCSPAGNKPLVWSGRLMTGVSRRLAETAKFVCAVAEPGGLERGAEGFKLTLRVRLIHAQVRRLIRTRGGWRGDLWGEPINQHDMLGTILLFAHAWLDGVEALGISMTDDEVEDYVHLWRVAGHVIGVEHELLPATRAEGDRLAGIIRVTQDPPDDDARRLVRAFLTPPKDPSATPRQHRALERRMQAYAGAVRGLLGDEVADQLAIPRDGWRFIVPAMREVVRRAEGLRRTVPGGHRLAVEAGRRHWQNVVQAGLMGIPAEFGLPSNLSAFAPRAA